LKSFGYTDLSGIDTSAEQVALAQEVTPKVTQGDLFELLDRSPETFQLITAMDVIEHLDKDAVLPFLDACHRALVAGGRLVLQTPNAESPMSPSVRYGDFTHEVCFSPASLSWLLALSGFRNLESREAGPQPLGMLSLGRFLLWRLFRQGLRLFNLVETGSAGSGVYTRVFLATGKKP
jgi:SAM-dependent methyltransferase